ncbi:hypothetical protein KIN20_013549 [Parelaphostrongylus tenuis]|uniref:C2H2-type domain-containing protein n=1 Tax=Parelaphostrongylus tenuis TaxID=148309 RepID=A0AAD5N265_PARTN|nr:hypothetical protein KIN20_013549 [Parelaphostrongylus tenuis]
MEMVHENRLHMCPHENCNHPGYKCAKALQAHIRSVHTNVRPYVCEICGKTFVRGSDRRSHLLMHGEKQFQCQCGKKFRRPIYLRNHRRKCPSASVGDDSEQLDETKAIAMIMNSHSICPKA